MRPSTQRRIGLAFVLAAAAGIAVWGVTLHPSSSVGTAHVARTVSVPLDVRHVGADTSVDIPVRIEGHGPYWFTLDTGASTSAISSRLVKRLHLTTTGASADFETANGPAHGALYRVGHWTAGTLPLQRGAVVTQLKDLGDIDGLLGADQLSRFGSIHIDFTRQQLRITPSSSH
jgi:predicted aspartyl protease